MVKNPYKEAGHSIPSAIWLDPPRPPSVGYKPPQEHIDMLVEATEEDEVQLIEIVEIDEEEEQLALAAHNDQNKTTNTQAATTKRKLKVDSNYNENAPVPTSEELVTPPAGKYVKVWNPNGPPITAVTPMIINDRSSTEYAYVNSYAPAVHSTCFTIHEGLSKLPFEKYSRFLTQKEDVVELNRKVLGKLTQWRCLMMDLLLKNQDIPWLQQNYLETQFYWVKDDIFQISKGIEQFNIPVEILHKEALKLYVKGINSDMTADLIYNLSNCRKFEIIGVPYKFFKTFVAWTKFYDIKGTNDSVRAYGCHTWKLGMREEKTAWHAERHPITRNMEQHQNKKMKIVVNKKRKKNRKQQVHK